MLVKKVLKEIPPKRLDKFKTSKKSDRYLGVAQVVKDKKCGEILVVFKWLVYCGWLHL